MKTLLISIIICILFTCAQLLAQTFSGKVTDEQNQPVEFANVALYSLPDSILITGTVTNQQGEFSLVPNGTKDAFLKISFLGYQTQFVTTNARQIVVLKTEATQLGEVFVKGNLPKIHLKNDALVTTVQNSVLSKAGTVGDVLKRLPSITSDKGVFSVFGKGEAKIYINNREMRDVSELDNLSSADIKDVEIVANPGARYDASVKAVIRIHTVRKTGDGFGFDVRSSYWQSQNTDLTQQLNANYRRNGWDVFGTLKYNRDAFMQNSKLEQKTFVDTLWTQENSLYIDGISHAFTGILGANYEISPKHYLGMKYTLYAYPQGSWLSTLNSSVFADAAFYDKWKSVEDKTISNKPTHHYNAYYNGSFGDLSVDLNTDFYTGKQYSQSLVTETSQEYENRVVNSENNVKNRLFAIKLVLSYPVLGGNLSAGNEYTDTHRDDDYRNTENIVPSSNTTIKESNNSFFVEYSRQTPIGQMGAGLRYENVRSDYFGNGKKIDDQSRYYQQWFPNISLATKIKDIGLQLSYTAKTRRPTYRQLSSNVFYANRFTLQTGNPFLKPSTIHDITLVGTWKFAQLMVSYKNEDNSIIYWTEQQKDNPKISVIAYRNLKKRPTLTIFLTFSPTFGIWSPQLSGGFVKQWVSITSNDNRVDLNSPMFMASLKNSFSFPNGFLFTLDANFQGKGDYQNVYFSRNQFVLNLGLAKSFFDDRLSIDLKGHDIFRASKDGNLLKSAKMEFYQLNYYDSREVELTVRYKFNSVHSKYKGRSAGSTEIDRLK